MARISTGRKSGLILRGGSMRRETSWLDFPFAQTTIAAASTAALLGSFTASALALRPFTIVRTRGILQCSSDQQAASEAWGLSYGLAVVSEQASAIGITAVPTPITDQSSDLFFVYESLYGRFQFQNATGTIESGAFKEWDSKAMRKVNDSEDLVVVAETPAFVGSALIIDGFRMLVKLH